MKTYLVDFTINDGEHEFGEHFFLEASNMYLAENKAEEIAERENNGTNYDKEGNRITNYLHDYTSQSMSIDSVRGLTKEEEKVLRKFLYCD